jgi:hypothetical protein
MPTRFDDLHAPVRHAPRSAPLTSPQHCEERDHPSGLPSSGFQAGHPRGRTSAPRSLLLLYGNLELIGECPSHRRAPSLAGLMQWENVRVLKLRYDLDFVEKALRPYCPAKLRVEVL